MAETQDGYGVCLSLDGCLLELPRDPFKELLDIGEPCLRRRRACLDDIDLMVKRLDLRQLHRNPPFESDVSTVSPAPSSADRIRESAVPISVDRRSGPSVAIRPADDDVLHVTLKRRFWLNHAA